MIMSRSLLLALLAGIAGIIIGRALPRDAPSAGTALSGGSASPAPAPPPDRDCKAARAELGTTRAQLAICLAYRAVPAEPESSAEPARAELAPSEPIEAFGAETRRTAELLDSYPEAVIVRRMDGTTGIYRPDERVPDSAEILARKFSDGRIGWYAGPDAGPPSDPAALVRPRDLAGPDGTVTMGAGQVSIPEG